MNFGIFFAFFLVALPTFLMVFLVKCVDLHSYRKLDTVNETGKRFLLTLSTVVAAHLLFSVLQTFLFPLDPTSLLYPIVLIPLFSVIPLFVLYLWERKGISAPPIPLPKAFAVNRFLILLFDIFYGILFYQWLFPIEFEILSTGSAPRNPEEIRKDTVLLVGTVLLIVAFTVIKILVQKKDGNASKQEAESKQ